MIDIFSSIKELPNSSKIFYAVSVLLIPLVAFIFDVDGINLAIEVACYIALAQLWNLLAGYAGLMSIGQQLFVGIGSYALFLTVIYLGAPIYLSLLTAPLMSFAVAYLVSKIIFRLNGAYFAIGTWVLADTVMLLISKVEFFGSASGLSLPIKAVKDISENGETRQIIIWVLAAVVSIMVTLISHLLLRSKLGLGLTSIRDSEDAARSLGVDVLSVKRYIYLYAAVMTGLVGAIIFLHKLRISPQATFDISDWTASVIFIVVIGGLGYLEGAIIGAIIFFFLRTVFADYGTWYLMMLGGIAIVTMLLAPQGLWGEFAKRSSFRLFPVTRFLKVKDKK